MKSHPFKLVICALLGLVLTAQIASAANGKSIVPQLMLLLFDEDFPNRFRAIITGKLNDTGLTGASDLNAGNVNDSCVSTRITPSDCNYGRDAGPNADEDGVAGFSFVKLDENGVPLANDATEWSCVGDNVTGLMWEVKTAGDDLRSASNKYTWWNGSVGQLTPTLNPKGCGLSEVDLQCNTLDYTRYVNSLNLCGHTDWRLPTVSESISITNYAINTVLDNSFFSKHRWLSVDEHLVCQHSNHGSLGDHRRILWWRIYRTRWF